MLQAGRSKKHDGKNYRRARRGEQFPKMREQWKIFGSCVGLFFLASGSLEADAFTVLLLQFLMLGSF